MSMYSGCRGIWEVGGRILLSPAYAGSHGCQALGRHTLRRHSVCEELYHGDEGYVSGGEWLHQAEKDSRDH